MLKKRSACPMPAKEIGSHDGTHRVGRNQLIKEEANYERKKKDSVPAGGYLLGRHPECGKLNFVAPNAKLTFQIPSSMFRPSVTAIAYYSVRINSAAL